MTISTIWTPRHVKVWVPADSTPATTETIGIFEATKDYQADFSLNFNHTVSALNEHQQIAITAAGAIDLLTAQTTSVAGSFRIVTVASGRPIFWVAWGDGA